MPSDADKQAVQSTVAKSSSDNNVAALEVAALFAPIQDQLKKVEVRLQQELSSQNPAVDQVIRHGYRLGGKRLRPALVLLTAQAVGNSAPVHELLGVVVEMIHTATLVHDDVLDEADLRRHVDTVNARWGNETSVLLGDFLFSHAFYLASTAGDSDYREGHQLDASAACKLIGKSTNRVCHGELRQTLSEGDLTLSADAYYEIIDGKTAELCACCCELGARYAGASEEACKRLASFGRNLGMAFQIADDLLDFLGNEEETGKTTGADLAKQKITLPLIYTRDSLVNGPRNSLEDWLTNPTPESHAELRKLADAVGGIAYAQKKAIEFADQAIEDIAFLEEGETKRTLASLAKFASRRRA